MIAGTHVAFATTLYLGGAALFEYQPDLIGWGLAAGAALLPDIDLPTSRLGRVFFFVSTRLEREFGHRTITHSILALVVVAILASLLYPYRPIYFWSVVGGYWSHLWIDMANIRGADLLWPAPVRVVFPGNRKYRIETGNKAEMVLLIALMVFSLVLFPASATGFRVGLQHLLGNFEMAHDNFVKDAGGHWYTLKLEAIDNMTLEHIHCDCTVVGAWRKGLIVLDGDRLRAVGKSETAHNLYPVHAELLRGAPLRVVSQRVEMRGRTLRWLLGRLDTHRTYFLLGQIRVASKSAAPVDDLALYRPAVLTGGVLRIHYAREQDLGPYLDMPANAGEVFVQFWLKPGEDAVELVAKEPEKERLIPQELQGYL